VSLLVILAYSPRKISVNSYEIYSNSATRRPELRLLNSRREATAATSRQ